MTELGLPLTGVNRVALTDGGEATFSVYGFDNWRFTPGNDQTHLPNILLTRPST